MRIKSTSVFGILLAFILALVGWEVFKTDPFLIHETEMISGKIIEVFPSKEVNSYNRRIKYVYSVQNKDYFDFKKLDTSDEKQVVGNELRIRYSVKNPKKNKVEILLNNYKNPNIQKYYSNTENGYIEMYLINGVFKYKEFAEKGKIVNDFIGDYSVQNDSIHINHYNLKQENNSIEKPLILVSVPETRNQLMDLRSKRIFKKFANTRVR